MFLNLSLRAYCHATEDASKITRALQFLLPEGELTASESVGHHGNPIIVLESKTSLKSHIEGFWQRIQNSISGERILQDLHSKIDEDCVLHIRLDKQKAYLGEIEVVSHEDVIAVTSKIECYPKKKDVAIKNAYDFFKQRR